MKKVLVFFLVSFAIAGLIIGINCGRQISEMPVEETPSLQIYDVRVTLDYPFSNEVIIEWKTDRESWAEVEFGETTSYGYLTPSDEFPQGGSSSFSKSTKFRVLISDLDPRSLNYIPLKTEAIYHFRIKASEKGLLQNPESVVFSEDYTFTIPEIVDSDGDGYSDEFEVKIAKTNPLIPNQRYILGVNAHSSTYSGFEDSYKYLTEKCRVPPENITIILGPEATCQNIENALNQLAQKVTENDIVELSISTHGVPEGLVFYREGATEEWKTSPPEKEKSIIYPYWFLDQYLDKIKARAVIILVWACYTEEGTIYNALRDKSRIILTEETGGFNIEALGEEKGLGISWRYVFGKPAPLVSPDKYRTEENPGIIALPDGSPLPDGSCYMWRALDPWDKVIKKKFNSIAELYQAIDKDRNGYISIGEAHEWEVWLKLEASKEDPEYYMSSDFINYHRPIENLSLACELYFGHYTPKELR